MAQTNPLSEKQSRRLLKAADACYETLRRQRSNYREATKELVGAHYSENGTSERRPLNLYEMGVNTYARLLSPQKPRALGTSQNPQLVPAANTLALAIDRIVQKIRFTHTWRRLIKDAIMSVAISKCALSRQDAQDENGAYHDASQPFVDRVSLDQWVHDVNADSFEQVSFCGQYRYPMPYDYVMESKRYSNTGKLKPTSRDANTQTGEEKTAAISRVIHRYGEQDYREHIELCSYWLPAERLYVTYAAHGEDKPLLVVEWNGPPAGPYRMLSLCEVPDQIIPLAPGALWMDIHDLVNRLFLKLGDQAERQKTIPTYESQAAKDAERVVNARDGQMIRVDSVQRIKEIMMGGIDPRTMAFLLQLKDLWSWDAGNMDMLAGLGPQSPTLGQDALLAQSASKRVQEYQERSSEFMADVFRDMAWYVWSDPDADIPVTKSVPGTDISVPTRFRYDERQGTFPEYEIDLDPYSAQTLTPSQRLSAIRDFVMSIAMPLQQSLAQQGYTLDAGALVDLWSRYGGLPELSQILKMVEPTQGAGGGEGPGMAPHTVRENVRVNRPEGTSQSRGETMSQLLMGAGAQPGSMARLGA